MTTLITMRNQVRDMLNETLAGYWTDAMLNRWINDACRDIARRTETLLDVTNPALTSAANTQDVNGPTSTTMLRIHKVEHKYNGETFRSDLQYRDLKGMDSLWGSRPDMPGRPLYYTIWRGTGVSGVYFIRLFPVPISAGTLTVYYYRNSVDATLDTSTVDVAPGYEELVENYCEYKAKRRDGDPTWQEAKSLYEEKITQMIANTRRLSDQGGYIVNDSGMTIPQWLYAGDLY